MTSKRKRNYLFLLAVSGAAMFVDRYVVGRGALAPQDVSAMSALETSGIVGAGRGPESAALIPEVPFPKALPSATDGLISRNLFLPPAGLSQVAAREKAERSSIDSPIRAMPATSTAASFSTSHRLDAVINDGRLAIAVVDGEWLRAGGVLDGCTLTDIQTTQVHFQCNDGGSWLSLVTALPLRRD